MRIVSHLSVALAILTGAIGVSERAHAAPESSVCGPSSGKTVASDGHARVYLRGPIGSADSVLYGCLKATGRSVRLGPNPLKHLAAAVSGPFAANAPWAGAVEQRQVGLDAVEVQATTTDLRRKRRLDCKVGVANRPGQMPRVRRLFITDHGSLAWTVRVGDDAPVLGICEAGTVKPVEAGPGFVAASVRLVGHELRWVNEDGPQSLTLR